MSASGNSPTTWLAVDLGASSGRVMAGWLQDGRLTLQEMRRFENVPVERNGHLCWNFEGLIDEIFQGLEQGFATAREAGRPVASIGIDSWGVDFGLIGSDGELVGDVVNYRDARTNGMMKKVCTRIGSMQIFEATGIQFMELNTIFQLAALKEQHPEQLERADRFLMIADLVAWRLTGQMANEFTNATTTQLYDPRAKDWAWGLIDGLELPRRIFHAPLQPGAVIGPLKPELARKWNAGDAQVVTVATHDTGSAVAAVPAKESPFAYLSCGTWSLLGTETPEPVINAKALALNFTNEGGINGTTRLLKNIMGLWILQECRAQWKREGRAYSWDQIAAMSGTSEAFACLIDVDDPAFLPPGDMPSRVREYCRKTLQTIPESDAAIVRCVLESLALQYIWTIAQLESLCDVRYSHLHMVGGGVQNRVLCQWTANATDRTVYAGPTEATALGNIGVQMLRSGVCGSVAEMRRMIGESAAMEIFEPRDSSEWPAAFAKYMSLKFETVQP